MSRWVTATSLCLLCAVASAQRPEKAEDESALFVEEGRAALKRRALDEAAKALDQAIALNPRRVEAYVLRSAVYAARKRYKEGVAVMRKAQAIAPTDPEVLTALGSDLVLSGNKEEGIPLLQQVAAKEPARYDAQLLLGIHWHATGKWPDAVTALEAYFAHRPDALGREDAQHQIELADSYLRFRQPQKALALFQTAAKTRKEDLRARIGIAWSMAAIDCAKARGLLHELEPIAEQHPEIWLVDGRCALALGDSSAALALGRRYLERAPQSNAAGHALVGEAYATRNLLPDARKELEIARKLEPARRRWTVRLAFVLRRSNAPADAVAMLDQLGAPSSPSIDPDWWSELGEALLANNEAQKAVTRLTPVLPDLPRDAGVRTVLGAAQLAAGQGDAAIKTLEEAEAIQSTPRSRKLLADALTTVATAKLATDAAAAEPMLARAVELDAGSIALRNLGIARLQLNKPADAVAALDRAAKADSAPLIGMLAGRAHAAAGDIAGARSYYDRALAADKDNVEIALDWAATEVAIGDPVVAVSTLEKTPAKGAQVARYRIALANARHAAALAQIKSGNGTKALELMRAETMNGEGSLTRKCDLAVAAVVAGDANAALAALRAIQGQTCPFPPPADTQAAPILIAFTEGLSPKRAGKAVDRLTALGSKATGAAAQMLGTAIRVVALNAAQDAYRNGQLGQARKYLATARSANARVGLDEVAHNLAVLDLAEGHVDAAIAQLEKVAARVPEAFVNLGVAYERKGEHVKALDAWRRARKAGVRFGPLADWIESKERIYGENGS